MNALTRACTVLVVLFALAGCNSLSTDKPIGVSAETQTDARLTGAWEFIDLDPPKKMEPKEHGYCFFLPQKDNGGFRVVAVVWADDKSESGGDMTIEALTGKAGDHWFLNFQHLVTDGKPEAHEAPGYQAFLYRLDSDGTLRAFRVSAAGFEKLAAAVERGRIAGVVTIHGMGTDSEGQPVKSLDIEITADQKALDAYFAENASEIFTEPAYVLRRVTRP